jgi:hypothetical protein
LNFIQYFNALDFDYSLSYELNFGIFHLCCHFGAKNFYILEHFGFEVIGLGMSTCTNKWQILNGFTPQNFILYSRRI